MINKKTISWWSNPRGWLRAILMLDDTPHSIALGTAIGVFIAFTPTVGIQMILVMLVALITRPLFRFNTMAGLISVYITNPLTLVPIYWLCYRVGTWYIPADVSHEEFSNIMQYDGLRQWWHTVSQMFVEIGLPLLVGSLIVASCSAALAYPVMFRLARRIQRGQQDASTDTPKAGDANPTREKQALSA